MEKEKSTQLQWKPMSWREFEKSAQEAFKKTTDVPSNNLEKENDNAKWN